MNSNIVRNKVLVDYDFSDKRRKTALVLDVETTLGDENKEAIFDIGWTISSVANEKMVMHRSYIIEEVFLNMKQMHKAYYFNKYPKYVKALAEGKTQLIKFNDMVKQLNNDIQQFNVYRLYAYNSNFDSRAINHTNRMLNNNTSDLNYDVKCLWHMSTQTFMATRKYVLIALEKEWISEKGNIKTSAEMAWRYLSGEHDFIEEHTGLEDSIIETKILWKMKNYAKLDFEPHGAAWRLVKEIKDQIEKEREELGE